jgi:hypothetical protein
MKTKTHGLSKRIAPLVVLLTVFAWSCDLFEDDVVPDEKEITLGQTDFYTLPNASAVIDLKSLVKSYSQVSLTITDQPTHGDLEKIADAVFQYKPDVNFKGKDYFLIDIKSNGTSVLKDSISITIGQDTTDFPCGLYAVHDSVTILYSPLGHHGVSIQVLDNDRICGIDKTDVDVTIFSGPSHGVASVVEVSPLEIRYTADAAFSGDDHLIYKISDPSDTSAYSLALVTVSVVGGPCTTTLQGDFAEFEKSSSVKIINVFQNDNICAMDSVNDEFTIIREPSFGTATTEGMGIIHYLPDTQHNFTSDSLVYKYCHNNVCQTAGVRIGYLSGPCNSSVNPDSVSLPLNASSSQILIHVLNNDNICEGVKSITITNAPDHGTATVQGLAILYEADSPTSSSDSLTYMVCDQLDVCATAGVSIRRE